MIYFIQVQPYFGDIGALKIKKQEYDEALANSRELQTLKDKLLSQYNEISQNDIEKLRKLLPSYIHPEDPVILAIMIDNIVKTRGLLLKNIDIGAVRESDNNTVVLGDPALPYKTVDLSFSVAGPYPTLLTLLADLEKSLELIDVKAIGFSSAAPTDIYEFSIGAKTYVTTSASIFAPAFVSAEAGTAGEGTEKGINEILAMLMKIRSIKIDSDFFESDVFKSLVDFVPILEMPKEYGRPNPFAPLELGVATTSLAKPKR